MGGCEKGVEGSEEVVGSEDEEMEGSEVVGSGDEVAGCEKDVEGVCERRVVGCEDGGGCEELRDWEEEG